MYKKQRRRQRIKQVGMIIFLALIVLGFTVPGFIQGSDDPTNAVTAESRLCNTDADCYLTCEDSPVQVMCNQNLCVQNACDEGNPYRYKEEATIFSLYINPEGTPLELNLYSNAKNIFVKFGAQSVDVYSFGLTLQHILEDVDMGLTDTCLIVGQQQYCTSNEKTMKVLVNNEEREAGYNYVPQQDDVIVISYS